MKKVVLELPDDQAMALAQLAKRLGYDDAERLSSRYDGGEERDAMLASIDKLQRALAEAGFGRPSSWGRFFFTVRHAIHSAMHQNQRNTTHR